MIEVSTPSITERIDALLQQLEERKKMRDMGAASIALDAYYLAKESGNKKLIVSTATALTHYYTEISSEFQKAIKYLQETIAYLDDFEDCVDKAEFYRRLGLNYDFLGELINSKKAYDQSIRLIENTGINSEKGLLTLARSLFNLSIIYGSLSLENLAEQYLKRASDYFSEVDYKPGIARCYISFGVALYERKGSVEETLSYYEKAAALAKELSDDPPYCIAMGNIGIVNAEAGNFVAAIAAAKDALEVAMRSTNKSFQFSLHRQLGRIYQLKKDYEKSNEYYTEGEKIFIETGASIDHMEFYRYWAETLFEMGNHKEGYEKLHKFLKNQDELHKVNKEAAVSDAMLRFQVEEGKKEQELLKKKNAEIETYVRKLEISNSELNQFAHVASHDMKEPLRMVTNYSQLLKRSLNGHLAPEQKEYIEYVNDGAKRMVNVINSLLDLSKITGAVEITTNDFNQIVEDVKLSLKLQIHERNVKLKCGKMPVIRADRTHMAQLFQNLVSNAIKYNKSDFPEVVIEYFEDETNHTFSVSDNGIGISQNYREKVFAIFQRLHDRNQYEGNGIGLSICKKIIDNMNGKIWVEDSSLGGCKFCFTIPKHND
jgi:signal transduction histidine kinase